MKPPEDLQSIVKGGLCLGCGLCQAMAGSERVAMATNGAGRLRPLAAAPLNQGTMDRIRVTCPGIRIDASEPAPAPAAKLDVIWGPAVSLLRGRALPKDDSSEAEDPGVASALVRHLLESGEVDVVLGGGEAEAGHETGLLSDLRRLLDEGRRFAVFGRPCDIAGLRNLARLDDRVERFIPLMISHFCAGLTEAAGAVGQGDQPRLQFRCSICPDAGGAQADIVLGLGEDGRISREALDDDTAPEACQLVIGRSARGAAVLKAAEAAGVLQLAPLSFGELNRAQDRLHQRKIDLWAGLVALLVSRRRRPRYRNLRIWSAARGASWARKWRTFLAMRRRLNASKNLEPPSL